MKPKHINWLSKIPALLSKKITGNQESLSPQQQLSRKQRWQWACVCAAFALLLNVAMYFAFKSSYPSEDQMNFEQEVDVLLAIQGYLVKKNPQLTPSMDSIRDLMFGQTTYGRGIRDGLKNMIRDHEKLQIEAELLKIVETSKKRWDEAEQQLAQSRTTFLLGFFTLSLGLPAMSFLLGFPGFQKLQEKLAARRATKMEAAKNRRKAMAQRSLSNLEKARAAKLAASAPETD